jgi:multiple sugar transport system permease protein
MGVVYALLVLGALTTLYPFVLMVTTALRGQFDQNDTQLWPSYLSDNDTLYRKYLDDKYSGDASMIASTRLAGDTARLETYRQFLRELPTEMWIPAFRMSPNQVTSRLQTRYQAWLRSRFRNDIAALNRTYLEENVGFQTVSPPAEMRERKAWTAPDTLKFRDCLEFKQTLPVEWRIPVRVERIYQEYARGRTRNQFSEVPPTVRGRATSFETLRLVDAGAWRADFERLALPAAYRTDSVEARWAQLSPEPMPIDGFERLVVRTESRELRQEFAVRNFSYVIDYVVVNGRAIWNTALFCFLAIAVQLTVNPIAAYALSRYPVRQSGQILIFLLATMAFPAEVAMIPSFLLLKDFGLLNTFAALVLPVAANGYMIFLLKGFFDSLPQELFEAGQLDGAKETVMILNIALPLCRPVLGYLALLAFMGAYGAFIYAFLIAQDQSMWTLMVWIYQLQSIAPKSVMMAALTLAALPTLAVFLAAQNVILRGIVLPDER